MPETSKKAQDLCTKLSKPSETNAKVLKKLFPATQRGPGSSKQTAPKKPSFNPLDECIVSNQHQKKKASFPRPKLVKVMLLQDIPPHVPKGKARDRLKEKGNLKEIAIHRSMSKRDVMESIQGAFSNLGHFHFLSCQKSNTIEIAEEQELDGAGIMKLVGYGSLYLIQKPMDEKDSSLENELVCLLHACSILYSYNYSMLPFILLFLPL